MFRRHTRIFIVPAIHTSEQQRPKNAPGLIFRSQDFERLLRGPHPLAGLHFSGQKRGSGPGKKLRRPIPSHLASRAHHPFEQRFVLQRGEPARPPSEAVMGTGWTGSSVRRYDFRRRTSKGPILISDCNLKGVLTEYCSARVDRGPANPVDPCSAFSRGSRKGFISPRGVAAAALLAKFHCWAIRWD